MKRYQQAVEAFYRAFCNPRGKWASITWDAKRPLINLGVSYCNAASKGNRYEQSSGSAPDRRRTWEVGGMR